MRKQNPIPQKLFPHDRCTKGVKKNKEQSDQLKADLLQDIAKRSIPTKNTPIHA